MYSPRLLEHFQNPRFVGELPAPAVQIDAMNPACGDMLRLSVMAEGGHLTGVRFQVRGCTAAIAAGSALAEWLQGRDRTALRAWKPDLIEAEIGPLPDASRHVLALCADGVQTLVRRDELWR